MKYYVYRVRNIDTNKTLGIGETKNLYKRLSNYTQKPTMNPAGESFACGKFHGQNIELVPLKECETKEESRKWEGIFKQILGFEWTERTRVIKGGKIQGKKNKESGHITNLGKIQGQKNKELYSKSVLAFRKDTGEFVDKFESQKEAARQLKLNVGNVSRVIKGIATHTGGYTFQLATTKD
jgi:predicted GIY-YIG superfamily endonuclease